MHGQIAIELKQHQEATVGQIFGLISTLSMSGVALYALAHGYPVVAGIVCSTTIVGLVTVFVMGRRSTTGNGNGEQE